MPAPTNTITLIPTVGDAPDSADWLVGIEHEDGSATPLGRIVWFSDLELDENGEACVKEEYTTPPAHLLPMLREQFPA